MNVTEIINNLIADPIEGPFEGEDYWIEEDGTIQVNNNDARLAANILRTVNNSGLLETKLVKLGQRGDSILLGFDTLNDAEANYTTNIGYNNETLAEVKKDNAGKFCVYLDKKRATRMFSKMAGAKAYLKTLDADMRNDHVMPEEQE